MPLVRTHPIPTITEVFKHDLRLLSALRNAGFKSVVPVMLMPREALIDFDGIASPSASNVTKALARFNFGHHSLCERMSVFIEEQFGSVEDAPISILQVAVVHTDVTCSRLQFDPLPTIYALEDLEPEMLIADLVRMTSREVQTEAQKQANAGFPLGDIGKDVKKMASRLAFFDLEFAQQSEHHHKQ